MDWMVIAKIVRVEGNPLKYAHSVRNYDELIKYLNQDGYSLKDQTSDTFYESYIQNGYQSSKSTIFYFNTGGGLIDYRLNDYNF